MPILIVLMGVLILLLLIIVFRIHAFIALILVALLIGAAQGTPINEVMTSIKNGVGSTLGVLALILGFGAMLGGLIESSGAAQQITDRLIQAFGEKRITWALVLAGFIIGVPMFYTVAFVMIIPLIFSVAARTRLPILYLAIPTVSALSVTHGFLPPHPAPTAIAEIYQADISLTLFYGLILAVPTVILAGPLFGSLFKKVFTSIPQGLKEYNPPPIEARPSFLNSLITALLPVILMTCSAIAELLLSPESIAYAILRFVGDPIIALLLALLIAMYTLGIAQGKTLEDTGKVFANSAKGVAMMMLIIGGGGALKQVLIDSGISDYIVNQLQGTQISPLILAWGIAAALRIMLGSATVAALTAAGIAAPLIAQAGANPELLVLATGAGSLTFSQVNDTGFWLFKEYFQLSIMQTFRSWTMMETIVSIIGLIGCLILDQII